MDIKCIVNGIAVTVDSNGFVDPDTPGLKKSKIAGVRKSTARALYRKFVKPGNQGPNGEKLEEVSVVFSGHRFRYDDGKWLDDSGGNAPGDYATSIGSMLPKQVERVGQKYIRFEI